MTETVSIFPAFSSTFVDLAIQFCFRCKFSFHEKRRSSQVFFSTNHNSLLHIITNEIAHFLQGSNLTFDDNSQMASRASTWPRFSSHKCVSTSLGTCTAQNSHFYLIDNSNMRKCKASVVIKCNKLYNITCIVHGHVWTTISYSTELDRKEPNPTALLQGLSHLAANSICFKVVRDHAKSFSHVRTIFVLMKIEMCSFQNHRFLSWEWEF